VKIDKIRWVKDGGCRIRTLGSDRDCLFRWVICSPAYQTHSLHRYYRPSSFPEPARCLDISLYLGDDPSISDSVVTVICLVDVLVT